MENLRLLILEDDKDFLKSYKKQIKLFNQDQAEVVVEEIITDNDKEAIQILLNEKIDAAIIDLKLGSTDVEYKGNIILDIIKNNLRFPAFVVTSNPEKIEEERDEQNDLYKLIVKGTEESDFTQILNKLAKIHLTGITKILGKSGQIEKYLNIIFWKHLSKSINLWASDNTRTAEQKEKSLLRFTLAHIQEHLDLDDNGGFEDLFPSEFYIIPPVKKNIITGDIVSFENSRYIILTPNCDIVQKKAEFIMFCKIKPLIEIVKNYSKLNLNSEINDPDRVRLNNFIKNNNQRFYFIPPSGTILAGLIDFQDKNSISLHDVDKLIKGNQMTRIATVSMSFLKDIISRYSNCFSRQGSPDFITNEVYNKLF